MRFSDLHETEADHLVTHARRGAEEACHGLLQCEVSQRAEVRRATECEDAAVERDQPVTLAISRRCAANNRPVEGERRGVAQMLSVAECLDEPIRVHQPVVVPGGCGEPTHDLTRPRTTGTKLTEEDIERSIVVDGYQVRSK